MSDEDKVVLVHIKDGNCRLLRTIAWPEGGEPTCSAIVGANDHHLRAEACPVESFSTTVFQRVKTA
jgi:hypothetical protein